MPPKTRNQQKKSRKRKLNLTTDDILSKRSISHGEEESQHKHELSPKENGTLPSPDGSVVYLDIGGYKFATTLSTLKKEKHSMLAAMFSGNFPLKIQENGSIFVDRDGTYFRYVLNYLRGNIRSVEDIPKSEELRKELYIEADYYQLKGLKDILKENENESDIDNEEDSARSASINLHIIEICMKVLQNSTIGGTIKTALLLMIWYINKQTRRNRSSAFMQRWFNLFCKLVESSGLSPDENLVLLLCMQMMIED